MTKQMKIVFYGLIVLVAILAFSTSFFAFKSYHASNTSNATSSPKPSNTGSQASTTTPSAQVSTAVTKASSASERPSDPADTYTIQRGDLLAQIAQNHGLTLDELSTANAIDDPNKIQAGQIILLPKNNQITFIVDNTKATNLQKFVDNNKYPWRLDPVETTRADNTAAYGLGISDNFVLKDKNLNDGQATITVSHNGRTYQIKLVQPVTKGEKGIWAIISIAPIP